jgi:hypothetical protein
VEGDLSRRRRADLWRQDGEAKRLQIGPKLLNRVEAKAVNTGSAGSYQVCLAIIDK